MAKKKGPSEVPKREAARKRYVESELGLREIAAEFKAGQRTVYSWSSDEDWPLLRQQHRSAMAAIRQQALHEVAKDAAVKEAATAVANSLDKYRRAVDFALGLTIKGLRAPNLGFKDLGQGVGALARLIQAAVSLEEGEAVVNDIPDELRALANLGGSEQPAPVFSPPGAGEDPPES